MSNERQFTTDEEKKLKESAEKSEYINEDVKKSAEYLANKEMEKFLKEHPNDKVGAEAYKASLMEAYKHISPEKLLEEHKKELQKDQEKQFDNKYHDKTIQQKANNARNRITNKKISAPTPDLNSITQYLEPITPEEQARLEEFIRLHNQSQKPNKTDTETNNPQAPNNNNQNQEPQKPNNNRTNLYNNSWSIKDH
jgi:hypothetical protein